MEPGNIGIHLEIYLLYLYLSQPRHGHLDLDFHVVSYLKSHIRSNIILDPHKNYFDGNFTKYNWEDLYGKVEKEIPNYVPEERVGLVNII